MDIFIIKQQIKSSSKRNAGDTVKIDNLNDSIKVKIIGIVDGKVLYNSSFILMKNVFLAKNFNLDNPFLAMMFGDFEGDNIDAGTLQKQTQKRRIIDADLSREC